MPLGSKVGVSGMETARPHERQKRTFSEDTLPQPGQVTMRTDCIPPRRKAVEPYCPILRVSNITVEKSVVPYRQCSAGRIWAVGAEMGGALSIGRFEVSR